MIAASDDELVNWHSPPCFLLHGGYATLDESGSDAHHSAPTVNVSWNAFAGGSFDKGRGRSSAISIQGAGSHLLSSEWASRARRALKFCEIQVNSQKSRPADSDQAA